MLYSGLAQDSSDFDPDPGYFHARELAFKGQYGPALDTLSHILKYYPEYTDVRSLLATVHSWNGDYMEARKQLNRITSNTRNHREAWIAAVKNEIYAGNYGLAMGMANKAKNYLGNDPEIAVLRGQILQLNQQLLDSISGTAEATLVSDQSETQKKEPVDFGSYKNRLGVLSEAFVFTRGFDPVILNGVEYTRYTPIGKILPRFNHAYRFQEHGFQAELDIYPQFSKNTYAFLNYAYSQSSIFPAHRGGAELFILIDEFEVSAGGRYLQFEDGPVTIYTGSLGWYTNNNYVSLRPYITPRENGTTSVSGHLMGRKYRQDREHFIGFNLIYGISPEIQALQSGNTLLAETLLYVESQLLNLEYQFSTRTSPHLFRATLGAGRQEFMASPGEFYWSFMAGLRYHSAF